MSLSKAEIEMINRYLDQEDYYRQQQILKTKSSLFEWIKEIGLDYLIETLRDLALDIICEWLWES